MAAALRIPVSVDMAQFDQGMERAKQSALSAATSIGRTLLDINKAAGILGIEGTAGIVKIGASAAQMVSPVTALNVAIKGTQLALSGVSTAAVTAYNTGVFGRAATSAAPWLAVKVGWLAAATAIVGGIDAIKTAIDTAMDEFPKLAEAAGKAGINTDLFQRLQKGAEKLKLDTDVAIEAITKLNEVSQPKLGESNGSDMGDRIRELAAAGNFKGNTGTKQFDQANDAESRWRALVSLITQAMNKGEQVAALDLGEKFLPPELLQRLRANGEALSDLQKTAEAIKPIDIISEEKIAMANDLKNRLEEAQATLSKSFIDLTGVGLEFEAGWTRIVEKMAEAVTLVGSLIEKMRSSSFWDGLRNMTGAAGLNSSDASNGIFEVSPQVTDRQNAERLLAARLKQPAAMQSAMESATTIQRRVRGDPSKNPEKDQKEPAAQDDPFETQVNVLQKHMAALEADALAVGKTADEHERLRAELALLNAAEKGSADITQDQVRKYTELRATMSAHDALLASGIKLTEEQVAQFEKLPGSVAAASAAYTAAQRAFTSMHSALDFAGNQIIDVLDAISNKSKSMADVLKTVIQALEKALLQAAILGQGPLAGILGMSSPVAGGTGGLLGSLFGSGASAAGTSAPVNIVGAAGSMPVPTFASGGDPPVGRLSLVGENGPEFIKPRGPMTVIPNEIVRSMGGGSVNASYAPVVNLSGTGVTQAQLASVLDNERRQFQARTVTAIQDARRRSAL